MKEHSRYITVDPDRSSGSDSLNEVEMSKLYTTSALKREAAK